MARLLRDRKCRKCRAAVCRLPMLWYTLVTIIEITLNRWWCEMKTYTRIHHEDENYFGKIICLSHFKNISRRLFSSRSGFAKLFYCGESRVTVNVLFARFWEFTTLNSDCDQVSLDMAVIRRTRSFHPGFFVAHSHLIWPRGDWEKWKSGMLASCQTYYHRHHLSVLLREKTLKPRFNSVWDRIGIVITWKLTSTDSCFLCVGAWGAVLRHSVASQFCLRLKLSSTGSTLVTIPGK